MPIAIALLSALPLDINMAHVATPRADTAETCSTRVSDVSSVRAPSESRH